MNKLRTADLFAGIGGIRKGFEQTGKFKTVFANDFEKDCEATYNLNYDFPKLLIKDILDVDYNEIPEFDFLLGGFPCQPFSIAGYRQGFKDEKGRGNLFFRIRDILKEKKPKGFLLENVKNLETHDGGNTFKVIINTLENELGYFVKHKVMNTKDYGNLPQNRERIYIVGFKDKTTCDNFEFPQKVKLTVNIEDLLDKDVDRKYIYNNKPLYERIVNDVKKENVAYQWRRKYVRENKNGVCPTLTANMGMGGHNVPIVKQGDIIRKITPRECAKFQGYEDEFILPFVQLSDSRIYKQIGNSVSVPVIKAVAEQILKALN